MQSEQVTPFFVKKEPKIVSITRTSDRQKKSLKPFSTSRLLAVNMCPRWGVVSAQKKYKTAARSMALEAGSMMHQVFAAVRIWQLAHIQKLPDHAQVTADRIFGLPRWKEILAEAGRKTDDREHLLNVSFAVLHTADWEDEPKDDIRTLANMELASIKYADERLPHMVNWPIYVENKKKPHSMVGIEQVFDVVVLFSDGTEIRYIGTVDGLLVKATTNEFYLDENKTAARVDEGWRLSFEMSHQITGYCAVGECIFGFPVMRSRVTGTKIKPTGRGEDCYPLEPLKRTPDMIANWGRWLYRSAEVFVKYKDDFENAPTYSHSCNRYFRPCSLISFCADTAEGRKEQWSEMVQADQSPSEHAIMEG